MGIGSTLRKTCVAGIIAAIGGAVACDPSPHASGSVAGVFGGVGVGEGDFGYPRAIAAAADGTVYVVDKTARVQRFDANGNYLLDWRMPLSASGKPVGLTVHPDGRVFVADTHYHRVAVYSADGEALETFGELGNGPGQFQLPTDVAVDADGFIYVSEYNGNDRITRWSPDLHFVASLADGPIDGVRMVRPAALDIDRHQTMWVADACNHRVIGMTLDGEVLTVFGEMGDEPGQMRYPYDIAVTPDDEILVCEYGNSRLQWFDRDGRSLRTWGNPPGREVGQLWSPWGCAIGAGGDVYVVDSLNSRVQIIRP